jgi:TRAP-type transport system periplasmic protein
MRLLGNLKLVLAVAGIGVVVVAGVGDADAQEVTLKAAIYTDNASSPFRKVFDQFVRQVNDKGAGSIRIGITMGPEAVPANQQPRALKDGVVDIVAAPPSYFENLVQGLGGLSAARVTTQQMRENGTFEAVNDLIEGPANARMVGLYAGDIPFYIFSNKEVASLAGFEDLRLRTTNTVKAFFDELGAQPLQVGRGEIYTALERGIVNGYSNINSELFTSGWIEVVDYRIGPGFYSPNIAIFMNASKYDSLTDEQKAVIDNAGLYVEGAPSKEMADAEQAAIDKAVQENGFKVIDLPPEESEKFLELAYESAWEEIAERAPAFSEKMKPLLVGN